MRRTGLVLAMVAMVALVAAWAWAGCPGMESKSQGSCAGKPTEGTSAQPSGDMPGCCHKQMQEGAGGCAARGMGEACAEHSKCSRMEMKMGSGCPMMGSGCAMMGAAPGSCCQHSGHCCQAKHSSHSRMCKSGGKAHMSCGKMGCGASEHKHGYATVIL